jgi:hypothetical protein
VETANTDNNVAATPSQNDNPTIESLAQALVSAIVAKVQEDIEPADQSIHEVAEEVIESNSFEDRVNELAYSQAEDFVCDFDISDKVEECLEYRDWDETVGSLIEGYVDNAAEDLQSEFARKDYVAALETTLEGRITICEGALVENGEPVDLSDGSKAEGRISDLEHFERRTMERLESIEEGLADKPCILHDSTLEAIERSLVEIKAAGEERNDLLAGVHARLDELEQVTASKFGQLDNIQIAFRGIVETMFAR